MTARTEPAGEMAWSAPLTEAQIGLLLVQRSVTARHLYNVPVEIELDPAIADSALVIFSGIDDPHGRAMALRNRALLEQRRGREERAMESYRSALEEFTRVGDSIGRANVLLHMARIELDREDEQAAARHLDEAFDVCGATGGNRVRSQARYVLSDLMQRQGRYEEADAVLRELLGVVRENRDMVGEIRILRRLGSVNARLGRREEAERQLREAVEICEQAMDQVAAAETRLELARLLAD